MNTKTKKPAEVCGKAIRDALDTLADCIKWEKDYCEVALSVLDVFVTGLKMRLSELECEEEESGSEEEV